MKNLVIAVDGPAGAGGPHRGQRQLPQRTWRRHGVRYLRRKRGGGDARRQGRNDQACLHQAEPQCDGHRVHRKSLRGCGRGRAESD